MARQSNWSERCGAFWAEHGNLLVGMQVDWYPASADVERGFRVLGSGHGAQLPELERGPPEQFDLLDSLELPARRHRLQARIMHQGWRA